MGRLFLLTIKKYFWNKVINEVVFYDELFALHFANK